MRRYGALEGVSKPELASELGEEQVIISGLILLLSLTPINFLIVFAP